MKIYKGERETEETNKKTYINSIKLREMIETKRVKKVKQQKQKKRINTHTLIQDGIHISLTSRHIIKIQLDAVGK